MADEARLLSISLVTPEGAAFEGDAEMVVVPGAAGEIGVLARHAPLVAMLKAGSTRVHVRRGGEVREFATGPGFFKVEQDRALALVDDAVDAAHIDPDRARRAARGGAGRAAADRGGGVRGRPLAGRAAHPPRREPAVRAGPLTTRVVQDVLRRREHPAAARCARAQREHRPVGVRVLDRGQAAAGVHVEPLDAATSGVSSTVPSSSRSIATTRRSTSAAPRSPTGCGADASAARCCLQTAARSEPPLDPPLDPPQPASARTASATGRA